MLFSLRVNYEPMLWYYGVVLMPLIVVLVLVLVSEVLVLVLVLEPTVLETSLPKVQENITAVVKVTLHVWTSNWGPRKLSISGTVDAHIEGKWAYPLPPR